MTARKEAAEQKKKRLARALKANLARRKAQSRVRQADPPPPPVPEPEKQ